MSTGLLTNSEMKFHEVANIFPMMSSDEYQQLVIDVKANGLKEPIWLYQDEIIDGRNRYKACGDVGVDPRFREWDGNGSLVSFVVSLNLSRRHLTSSQKAMIALDVEKQLADEIKRGRPSKIDAINAFADNKGEIPTILSEFNKESAHKAASITGTSGTYIKEAKKIVEQAPELKEAVLSGKLNIPEAKAVAKLSETQRADVLKDVSSGSKKSTKKAIKDAVKAAKQEEIAEIDRVDAISDPVGAVERIRVRANQTWQLGSHLLYCGDSSSEQFISLAKQYDIALAFADPPYNAGVAEWDTDFSWEHDYLLELAPIVAVTPGIAAIKDFMSLTRMSYKWSMSYWIDNGMTRGAIGFGNWIYVALFSSGSIYRNGQDFCKVSVSSNDRDNLEHKGRKPLSMMLHFIKLFSLEGERVIDPFLGTGSTLIVCEQTKRQCIGAESNPAYCESIIRRWEKVSGMKAEVLL